MSGCTDALGPHFCTPQDYDRYATPHDRAGDAAEVCDDPRHFELYPDTSPETTAAHVAAHLDAVTVRG